MRERKRNRLKNHNDSQEGYYFVTICTRDREEWFGKVEDGKGNCADDDKKIVQGYLVNP